MALRKNGGQNGFDGHKISKKDDIYQCFGMKKFKRSNCKNWILMLHLAYLKVM